jgi:hypothetical protein
VKQGLAKLAIGLLMNNTLHKPAILRASARASSSGTPLALPL